MFDAPVRTRKLKLSHIITWLVNCLGTLNAAVVGSCVKNRNPCCRCPSVFLHIQEVQLIPVMVSRFFSGSNERFVKDSLAVELFQ